MTTPAPGHDTVLVLDFGAQYAQLIARRIRECHVFSEVVACDIDPETVRAHDAKALVLSGGPKSVYEPGAPALDPRLLELGIPVLGLCYGQQAMARALGGRVERTGVSEYGRTSLRAQPEGSVLFGDLPDDQVVWMSHGDTVTAAPPGARIVASTDASPVAGFEDPERGLYGVQFHPEVAHTERGMDLFKNFLYEAAGCRPNWTSVSIIEEQEAAIRARVGEEVAKEHGDVRYLVQGTLYPDVVESGGQRNATIKSHHNVGGLPEVMNLELVEPLRLLFKDEVRKVGTELGLPEDVVQRQPFPGPGLAVRIVGEVSAERLETLRAADRIVLEEIRRAGLDRELWQWFAVLPAVRTVGVMGDGRTYAYPIVLRAVTSQDAMTADFARLPWEVLERISTRVVGEVPGVNRVAYDVTSKPPGTIEWE
jgi:GMP synthase (glutamine-hydrolysing) B subunit/GMP synthase (glutamine-hydrolysing) A subunit